MVKAEVIDLRPSSVEFQFESFFTISHVCVQYSYSFLNIYIEYGHNYFLTVLVYYNSIKCVISALVSIE